jgi:glutamate dehydrogenase/leucine dehydrogenase
MRPAFAQMWQLWQQEFDEKVPLRLAAYVLSVSRVVEAMKARGRGIDLWYSARSLLHLLIN